MFFKYLLIVLMCCYIYIYIYIYINKLKKITCSWLQNRYINVNSLDYLIKAGEI